MIETALLSSGGDQRCARQQVTYSDGWCFWIAPLSQALSWPKRVPIQPAVNVTAPNGAV